MWAGGRNQWVMDEMEKRKSSGLRTWTSHSGEEHSSMKKEGFSRHGLVTVVRSTAA